MPNSRAQPKASKGNGLTLAYLTTQYPKVSHTFIRRELREMERRGHGVVRLAIRASDALLADPVDQEEAGKTCHCLSLPIWRHGLALLRASLGRPKAFAKAMECAFAMGRRSQRGLIKHLAYLLEACTLLLILDEKKVDHVHVHFGTNATAVARLSRCLGGPSYSFTVHGPDEFDSAIGFDLNGKINDAAFVIAITDYCAAQLRRWCPPKQWDKIHIIHCTVGDDFFNSPRTPTPANNTFCCVGRLAPQKGQLILIEALALLKQQGLEANLTLVGDGELRPLIEAKVKEYGLGARVTITGYVSEAEVRRHIEASRALALPSFAEGLPMVIMESFAMGRPVISTYIAGIPELVRNHENGWLVPAGNVEQLVTAMSEALAMPDNRLDEMAAVGHDLTYKHHRTSTEGAKLSQLFSRYGRT